MILPASRWWGLRQVKFFWVPPTTQINEGDGAAYVTEVGGYWALDLTPEQQKYQSKFNEVIDIDFEDNILVAIVQQPDRHKYDTAAAPFWFDKETQTGWLIADPVETRQRSSVRQTWKFVAQSIAMIIAMYTGIGAVAGGMTTAATAVGTAVLGASTAAAYPVLTAALGQILISTALSGGDVESAAKNFVVQYAAGLAGDAAGAAALAATDTAAIAYIADAVVSAALAGRDIEEAAAMALLRYTAANPVIDVPAEANMDQYNFSSDNYLSDPAVLPYDFSESPTNYESGGTSWDGYIDDSFEQMWSFQPTENLDSTGFAQMPSLPTVPRFSPIAINAPTALVSSSWGISDFNSGVQAVSNAALAALNLRATYDRITAPTVNRPTTSSGSQQRRVTDSGVIQTLTPTGQITNSRPPVGQPHTTVSGGIVTNNGDGTYTLITSSGQSQRLPYGATAGPTNQASPMLAGIFGNIGSAPLLVGGFALLALLIARRR